MIKTCVSLGNVTMRQGEYARNVYIIKRERFPNTCTNLQNVFPPAPAAYAARIVIRLNAMIYFVFDPHVSRVPGRRGRRATEPRSRSVGRICTGCRGRST